MNEDEIKKEWQNFFNNIDIKELAKQIIKDKMEWEKYHGAFDNPLPHPDK